MRISKATFKVQFPLYEEIFTQTNTLERYLTDKFMKRSEGYLHFRQPSRLSYITLEVSECYIGLFTHVNAQR